MWKRMRHYLHRRAAQRNRDQQLRSMVELFLQYRRVEGIPVYWSHAPIEHIDSIRRSERKSWERIYREVKAGRFWNDQDSGYFRSRES